MATREAIRLVQGSRRSTRQPQTASLTGEGGEELRDVVGVVLEIGVHGDDDRAAGALEPGVEGRRLPGVPAESEDADPGILGRQLAEHVARAVGGAVVHEQDLEGLAMAVENADQLPIASLDVRLLVVGGDDHGEREAMPRVDASAMTGLSPRLSIASGRLASAPRGTRMRGGD